MRAKVLVFPCILLGATTLCHAQQTSVTVLFPDSGEREVWAQSGRPTAAPSESVRTGATSAEIPVSGKKPTDLVFVWDKRTGNLASRTLKEIQADGTWVINPASFTQIAQIKVHVEHGGKPLAAANVSVNDGARTQTALLDPSTNGDVEFFGLKPGQLKVTASYKTKTGDQKSVTQLVDAPFTRKETVPSAVISVADDVATVGSETSAAPTKPSQADAKPGDGEAPKSDGESVQKAPDGGNTIGSIVVFIVSLVVIGGVAYFIYRYANDNKDLVQKQLKQLGVDIPEPGDDQGGPVAPVAPVAPSKPEPPQKIILDDAAPDLIGSAAPMPMASAPIVTGEPKLISDTGDAMPLPAGETVVGREVGLGLSLVGESTVSRRHAQLVRNGDQVTLVDLGSTNGSYVNGAKVQGSTVLRPGDHVQFGAVKFRYEG